MIAAAATAVSRLRQAPRSCGLPGVLDLIRERREPAVDLRSNGVTTKLRPAVHT